MVVLKLAARARVRVGLRQEVLPVLVEAANVVRHFNPGAQQLVGRLGASGLLFLFRLGGDVRVVDERVEELDAEVVVVGLPLADDVLVEGQRGLGE